MSVFNGKTWKHHDGCRIADIFWLTSQTHCQIAHIWIYNELQKKNVFFFCSAVRHLRLNTKERQRPLRLSPLIIPNRARRPDVTGRSRLLSSLRFSSDRGNAERVPLCLCPWFLRALRRTFAVPGLSERRKYLYATAPTDFFFSTQNVMKDGIPKESMALRHVNRYEMCSTYFRRLSERKSGKLKRNNGNRTNDPIWL